MTRFSLIIISLLISISLSSFHDQYLDYAEEFYPGVGYDYAPDYPFDTGSVSSVCPLTGEGTYPWPGNCHKYVDCWNGAGTIKTCSPSNLVFNEKTGNCDWPGSTRCVIGPGIWPEEEKKKEDKVNLDLKI